MAGARERWLSRAVPVALAVHAAAVLRDYLQSGVPLDFDAHSHLARAWMVARALGAGGDLGWSHAWYGGFRLLEFHGPAWYALTGGLGLLLGDVAAAAKGVLFGAQLLAVLAVYRLLRCASAPPPLAGFGALLLLGSAQRMMLLGVIGNHPSALLYVAFPLLLAVSLRDGGDPPLRPVAGRALLLALLLLVHPSHALLALPGLLAFELTRLWQAAADGAARLRALAGLGASLVAAGAMTAFQLAPAWLQLDRVGLSLDVAQGPGLRFDPEPLWILAGLARHSWDHVFIRDHGTLWCALALAGGALSLGRGARRWRPFLAGLAATLAATAVVDDRAAITALFYLIPLCTGAADAAARALAARGVPAAAWLVAAPATAAALVFTGSATTDPPRFAPADALAAYARLPASATRSRTFDVTPAPAAFDGFYGPSSFSPAVSGRAVPFGAFPQAAPLGAFVSMALASALVPELDAREPHLSDASLDVLYLLHVQFLVDRREAPILERVRVAGGEGRLPEPRVLALRHASPALYARERAVLPAPGPSPAFRTRPLEQLARRWERDPLGRQPYPSVDLLFRTGARRDWEELLPLVRAMGIDRAGARAERIFVAGDPAPPAPVASGADGGAAFAVLEHREQPARVEIVARAAAPGFVRLSYAYDPGLRVTIDGRPVVAEPDALGGAVVVPVPAGVHEVSLRAPADAGRRVLMAGSAALAAVLGAVFAASARTRRAARVFRAGRGRVE